MALPFIPSDGALLALQAAVVAAPRPGVRIERLERLRGRGWAVVPLASIVVVVFAIRYLSDTATALTYLALVAVPPLAAVALAWGVGGLHPRARLRRLQGEIFGTVTMGYGDLFVAALLGALLARDRPRQLAAGVLTFAFAAVFDLLFLVIAELPATVPVAFVLIVMELRE